ncbi:putative Mg2+ transporter-C (MgtC) family protein [Nocardiopsis mwathae]|uniref:Putative Mg2+ transporter-C (MgtC) family protein n=1 Tax=Nocardiopsis mwathae TaxID=1472723 RepID=A0A7W9YL27_9ACTN|nr:MgtC/SapB family protein [Nocardiopsis mwathae]MBB6174037.1 putative Mg2+ transporter-C (MgtC) family protein [Nocardiopsis mwathae]
MIEFWEFALRLACALVLGALVGVERQWRARLAGLRTNALVATGAALFVLLAVNTPGEVSPTRIAAQVVSGIGFLGAGVILRDGVNVRGINTAATIWCAAAVGVLAGSGLYLGALMGALAVVAANVVLRPIAHRIESRPANASSEVETVYRLRAVCRGDQEAHVRPLLLQALSSGGFRLRSLHSEDLDEEGTRVEVEAELTAVGRADATLEQAVSRLSLEPGVSSVHWRAMEEVGV